MPKTAAQATAEEPTSGEQFSPPVDDGTGEPKLETPAEGEAPPEGKPEGEAAPPEKLTHESWMAQLEADPELASAHEEKEQERLKEISKEQYQKFQRNIQPAIDTWAQNSATVRADIEDIHSTLKQAVADGTLEPEQVAKAFAAYTPQMWWEGTRYALGLLGKAVEDDALANEFLGRIYKMASQQAADPDLAADLLQRVADPVLSTERKKLEDKGYKRGLKEGREAALEEVKAGARKGQGPPSGEGKAGSSKNYKDMTAEERSKLSPEERDALTSRR